MKAREIQNYKKCITCENCETDDGAVYCLAQHCEYKPIDYKSMMEKNETVNGGKEL